MIYIQSNDPVMFSYQNSLVSTITSAELTDNADVSLTVVTPLDYTLADGTKEWYAIFDPSYFEPDSTYKIVWSGKNTNGSAFEFTETGISVKISTDFYQTFIDSLRQAVMDDGEACDYLPNALLGAVKWASNYINAQPPVTNIPTETIPYNFLLDFSKIYLYRAKASREALETFNYSDIGKSFNLDRSPKLLALADNLSRSAEQQLQAYKKNLRPRMLGLQSRNARRSGASARSMMYNRVIFRSFIR